MRKIIAILLLSAAPASAQNTDLKFDIVKLCQWQEQNNNMDGVECITLETAAEKVMAELEAKADPTRKAECVAEANSYSGGSGFASYTVYTECLKNGPGGF